MTIKTALFTSMFVPFGLACAPGPRPTTLRALYENPRLQAIDAASTALLLVDFQQEFFTGRLPVVEALATVSHASDLLTWARRHHLLVVHVRNESLRPDSPIFNPTLDPISVDFIPALAPREGELVVVKHQAGAFSKTDLDATLRGHGIDTVIVAGIMTHLAVDTSVRDAGVLGYKAVVAADACTTRPLPSHDGKVIAAQDVHRVALAALADRFAEVRSTAEITLLPVRARRDMSDR